MMLWDRMAAALRAGVALVSLTFLASLFVAPLVLCVWVILHFIVKFW